MKEEVQKYLVEFLTLLKEQIKPWGCANHTLSIGEDVRLWLWVSVNEKWQSIIFDDNYDNREPGEVVESIVEELKAAGYMI